MDAFIFAFGLVVTLVACGAVGAIWWAALRDGEADEAYRRGERSEPDPDERSALRRVA